MNCDASGEAVSVVLEHDVTVRLVRLARVMVKRSWEVFCVVIVVLEHGSEGWSSVGEVFCVALD